MSEITGYKIVTGIGASDLADKVMAEIKAGWQPFGAPCVAYNEHKSWWIMSQAMILEEEKTKAKFSR